MLCPAAWAPRAVSATQAERRGAASNSQWGSGGGGGPGSQRQGEKSYLSGQGGTPWEPLDTHGSNPPQLAKETLTEGM